MVRVLGQLTQLAITKTELCIEQLQPELEHLILLDVFEHLFTVHHKFFCQPFLQNCTDCLVTQARVDLIEGVLQDDFVEDIDNCDAFKLAIQLRHVLVIVIFLEHQHEVSLVFDSVGLDLIELLLCRLNLIHLLILSLYVAFDIVLQAFHFSFECAFELFDLFFEIFSVRCCSVRLADVLKLVQYVFVRTELINRHRAKDIVVYRYE